MNITLNNKELRAALEVAVLAIDKKSKSRIPVLGHVLFSGATISATDLETAVIVALHAEVDGQATIEAVPLLAICKRLPKESLPNTGGWKDRHMAAIALPRTATGERAILGLIRAWREYAEMHQAKHEAPIGEDGYCGEYWEQIGSAIQNLLSADHGQRLDNGTLDAYLRAIAAEHGVDGESL